MKKILAVFLALVLTFSMISGMSVSAEDLLLKVWTMEPTGGTVAYLNLYSSSLNTSGAPIDGSNISYDKLGYNKKGIDGSAGYTIKMKSYQTTKIGAVIDDVNNPIKAGYTYFKSAMVRLNEDECDSNAKTNGRSYWTFTDIGAKKGFASDAASFQTKLNSYNSTTDKIPNYDWGCTQAGTIKGKITTKWQRLTNCVYRDASDTGNTASRERFGWVVLFNDDTSPSWSTNFWTGNWELVVDDYVVLEVPNTDMKAQVYPVACQVEISSNGRTAGSVVSLQSKNVYDVNPLVTPEVTYQWQSSSDNVNWTDVSGETSTSYTLKASDVSETNPLNFRLKVTATSENSSKVKKSSVGYSNVFSSSTKPSINKVNVTGKVFVGNTLTASADIVRTEYVKNTAYVWQVSNDGVQFADTTNKTTTLALTNDHKGKYVRFKVTVTDMENETREAFSDVLRIYSSDDTLSYYVDLGADENGSGTESSPYNKVDYALSTIKNLRKSDVSNKCVIYLRGGEFFLEEPIRFYGDDKNITLRNYPGEEVILTGGKHVDQKYIQKVTDKDILSRIVDTNARKNLYVADLSAYYDEIPEFATYKRSVDGWTYPQITNQIQVVVNGASLTPAKWPNTINSHVKLVSNATNGAGVQKFTYEDSSNRAEKWSEEGKKKLVIEGHFFNHYSVEAYYVDTVDAKNKEVLTKEEAHSAFLTDDYFYFTNILDEIDLPGESFIDTENKKVYFYGYGDMENPDILVPIANYGMITMNSAEDVTVQNLKLRSARTSIVNASSLKRCALDGCELKYFADVNRFSGDNNVVKNCYIYDGSIGGLWMSGGDPDMMTGGENIVENNKFNYTSKRLHTYGPALQPYIANKPVIKNNEIYNHEHEAVAIGGCNNTIFEYNHVHDNVTWTGDMGAIYWNMRPNAMGNEFRYNYFENNKTDYLDGWSQSIFADDTAPGYYAHHNIVYQGTRATSEGGTKFAFKLFGGQYAKITNNIFVDVPYGVQCQTYYPNGSNYKQTGWFLTQYGKATPGTNGNGMTEWNWQLFENICDSPIYESYYKGTQWEPYLELFSKKFYDDNLKNLDRDKDREELKAIAEQYAPSRTNIVDGNVIVKSLDKIVDIGGNSVETNTYHADTDILQSGNSMFKEYGKDFTLTAEGLAEVQKTIPGFENIDMSQIGVQPYLVDGKTAYVGGNAPTLENAKPIVTEFVTATYDFNDKDGDKEGLSIYEWYVSDKKDGTFKKIDVGSNNRIEAKNYIGKYVKFNVIPYDDTGLNGEKYESSAVLVEKYEGALTKLNNLIEKAEKLYDLVPEGNTFAKASASVKETFNNAITNAKICDTEDELKMLQACTDLENAIGAFENAVNQDASNVDTSDDVLVYSFMDDVNIQLSAGENIVLKPTSNEEMPKISVKGYITIDGAEVPAEFMITKGTKVITSGIKLFDDSATPSVTVSKAETGKITSVKFCDSLSTFSIPATFSVNNISTTKNVCYPNGNRVTDISKSATDARNMGSAKYARFKNDNGISVGVSDVTELIIYTQKQNEGGSGSGSEGGSGSSSGGGTSSGSSSKSTGRATGGSSPAIFGGGVDLGNTDVFNDIDSHWAKDDIMDLYNRGIVTGVTANRFEPNRNVTRAEFATLIVKALKLTDSGDAKFSDVLESDWFYGFVMKASKAGLIVGDSGMFRPNDTITRQEAAAIIMRAYEYLGKEAKKGDVSKFKDSDKIAPWANEYVGSASASGIISGMEDGTFAPTAFATRGQAVSLIKRIL